MIYMKSFLNVLIILLIGYGITFAKTKAKIFVLVTSELDSGTIANPMNGTTYIKNFSKELFKNRLITTFTQSGRYIALDKNKSNSLLKEWIRREKRTALGLNKHEISDLGMQFGVQFVCIVHIIPIIGGNSFFAKMVDVENSEIISNGEFKGPLANEKDLLVASKKVVMLMDNNITYKAEELEDSGIGVRIVSVEVGKPQPIGKSNDNSSHNQKSKQIKYDLFTDQRDGEKYKTVAIGEQTWMAENLNYNASGSKCYDNKAANCDKYGRLYDWNTAMKACPSGWHLPSDKEWEIFEKTVGGSNTASKHLKAKYSWEENGNGSDSYGFTALPGGYVDSDGSFGNVGYDGFWWSASEYNASDAYYRVMLCNREGVRTIYLNKSLLFSVRCLKDTEEYLAKIKAMEVEKVAAEEAEKAKIEAIGKSKVMMIDKRDGKEYKTIKIGEQTWMAENLNYKVSGSKCYDNKAANCNKYGRLYDWNTAMKACPKGWHIPSDTEWQLLIVYAGGEETAGGKLKATSDWYGNGNGSDSYGFAALPGGNFSLGGSFVNVGNIGLWWSASEDTALSAYSRYMRYNDEYAYYNGIDKNVLFSVRCLQDD